MLRITRVREGEAVTELKLEGQIAGDWVPLLEHECRASTERGRKVVLDLEDVMFVDRCGVDSLRRLREVGVEWVGAPLWIEDLLTGTVR